MAQLRQLHTQDPRLHLVRVGNPSLQDTPLLVVAVVVIVVAVVVVVVVVVVPFEES